MTIALLVSGYHAFVTGRLETGARDALREAGVPDADVATFTVPGAFELPQAAHGITRAAQETGVPIAFGVLTTNTAEEALARAGDGAANKGREAALAALGMAALYAQLDADAAGDGGA
jgi:6,7-dimethyl-8-ribityllumazine synthase